MKTLITIVLFLAASACSLNHKDRKAPVRVNGIPEKAFWVGGSDGGNWYLVENEPSYGNNAIIKIYNDFDGSLMASKRFMLICPANNQEFIEDLQKQITGFDGERILLKSPNGKRSCWLQ